jgi:hypothetical protein
MLLLSLGRAHAFRHALVVGGNHGGPDVESLRYAEADARRFTILLEELAAFQPENITTLLNPDSTALEKSLMLVSSRLEREKGRKNSMFVLYYSGHADAFRLKLGSQAYPLQRIQQYINTLPARIKIGVFDACQSGAVTRFKGGKRAEPFYLRDQKKIEGQVIIAASAADELAQESETLKGSIFSHHLLNGLRGSADFSGDHRVTLTEAYRYAYSKTVETTALTGGTVQHPSYKFNIHGQGQIVMTNLEQSKSGLLLGSDFSGRHLVLSENYIEVLADFSKKRGRDAFISLAPGQYTLIHVRDNVSLIHDFHLGDNMIHHPSPQNMRINPLMINRVKGANPEVRKAVEYRTTPLSTYSWGPGLGYVYPLNKALKDERALLKLSFANTLFLGENISFFWNADWILFGRNIGLEVGFDYAWHLGRIHPFLGAGLGVYSYEKDNADILAESGPSLLGRTGVTIDLTKRIHLQLYAPYQIVFNQARDQLTGLGARLLFSGKYKHVRVLKY